jgi:hypothetical protein
MQLAAPHQPAALFQVRSGCVFERPIGQEWTRSRMDPLLLPVADNANDAHVGVTGNWDILRADDRASVLSDKIYRVRHASDLARGRRINADHCHIARATGRRQGRDSCRRLGAERMADDNDPVRRMCAGIRRKGSVLPIAAIGDDVAALAKPPGDHGQAGADKQAVHDMGAGGRPRVCGKRCQQRHAAAHETHCS